MTISRSCSWCHQLVTILPGQTVFCEGCGHQAGVSRMECGCSICRRAASVRAADRITLPEFGSPGNDNDTFTAHPDLPEWVVLLEVGKTLGIVTARTHEAATRVASDRWPGMPFAVIRRV